MRIPPHRGFKYMRDFKQSFEDLAREHDIVLIPHFLAGVAAQPGMNLPDGIHPNEKGQTKVAQTVLKYLEPLL
jgi:acyl-CoA thioesterase I